MKNFLIEHKLEKLTYVLEMIITALIAIGVIIGLIDLFRYFPAIFVADAPESYEIFQSFLAYALVLIVGVELMLMIINHSTKAIMELILFVIARKMLIYSHTMKDLVLGTIAIAIVFAILKFLIPEDKEDIIKRSKNVYSASTKVEDIIKRTKYNIPVDKGYTVGGLVCRLADEACVPVTEGSEFTSGDLKIKVVKASEDGLIEEVMIKKKDEKDS
ncbi:hypothetical protein [Paratissierella segnis]|jgi:hypothetical protein|uniref:Transporter-associated domain-containing protein n=1 Tax=Paratissierella segnis TaxID=2763679 RepID=A0A926EQL3_9FIRM|nr:hypothetical protein [Paratissierella segnis]MBC8586700.1 hypothetical protein [Paratissierella segnis]